MAPPFAPRSSPAQPHTAAARRPLAGLGDRAFKGVTGLFAASLLALVAAMAVVMIQGALPAIQKFGWRFLTTSTWDPVQEVYGALPFLYGTVASSMLALLIAVPLSLAIAAFLSELAPGPIRQPLGFLVELLAAIPSVIYGLWGIFVLAPWLRDGPQQWLSQHFGASPLFSGPPYGVGMLAAGLILSVMILPTTCSICLEVFRAVPSSQREAALALGATRWETTRLAVFSNARSGIVGAIMLGLGRALGETMAVTMVIGNRPQISASLMAPGYTLASVIANEFSEATSDLYISALIELAVVLFALTILLNIVARWLVWRSVLQQPTRGRTR